MLTESSPRRTSGRFCHQCNFILIIFCYANQSVNRNILTLLCLRSPLPYTILKFSVMLGSLRLHWRRSLIKIIDQKRILLSANCIMNFYQINYVQTSTSMVLWRLTFKLGSLNTSKCAYENPSNHLCDVRYRLYLSMYMLNISFDMVYRVS